MEEKGRLSKSSPINIFAGCAYLLVAITIFAYYAIYSFNIWIIPYIVVCIALAVLLFTKNSNSLLTIGVLLMGVFIVINYVIDPYVQELIIHRYISTFTIIRNILLLSIIYIASPVMVILITTGKVKSKKFTKVFFIIVAILVLQFFIAFIIGLGFFIVDGIQWGYFDDFFYILKLLISTHLLEAISMLLAMLWYFNQNVKSDNVVFSVFHSKNKIANHEEEGYIDLAKHVLLLILTFGIWHLIWIVKTTAYLNKVKGEELRDSVSKLLLCMFVPFYLIYWTHKSAESIDMLAINKGVKSDISTKCLILAIFIPIVPPIIMQQNINEIIKPKFSYNTNSPSIQKTMEDTSASESDIPEILIKYKKLLDDGIINQEEFDQKKKELLGL